MPENDQQNITLKLSDQESIGQKSDLQPIQSEPSITLNDVRKEITEAMEKVKKDFLKEAEIEAGEEIRKQVQTDKASLITVFGIFASIISFLTIEFQFLRTICSYEKLVGFTLILASLLLCFNLALDYLVKSRTDTETPKPSMVFEIFVAMLFILGICFMFLGNEEKCKDNKVYEKYSENFRNQQTEFNQGYINELNFRYNELKAKIADIEKLIRK